MLHVFAFIEFYVAPFLFAVGLMLFVYGVINYFIIGPGFEEERKEIGRQSLLWSATSLFVGLILFWAVSWLFDFTQNFDERIDIGVSDGIDVVPVPNVPGLEE